MVFTFFFYSFIWGQKSGPVMFFFSYFLVFDSRLKTNREKCYNSLQLFTLLNCLQLLTSLHMRTKT